MFRAKEEVCWRQIEIECIGERRSVLGTDSRSVRKRDCRIVLSAGEEIFGD